MFDARTGNALTSASLQAAELYREAVDLILGSESGATEALDEALALDGEFALAAAARYCVAQDVGETGAEVHRERAQRAAANATDWEREHVDVLIGLLDAPGATLPRARAYIENSPADLLVISQLTGYLFFYGGPSKLDDVLEVFESVEPALGDDWAFLARLGFAASEAGQRGRARPLLECALEIRPQALYSIHGLAHLLHDDGAAEESARLLQAWIDVHGAGAREGQMYGHVQWHLALSEWQKGDRDAAMRRYLAFCAPETTTCGPILTLADCGGFLLRDYLQTGRTRPRRMPVEFDGDGGAPNRQPQRGARAKAEPSHSRRISSHVEPQVTRNHCCRGRGSGRRIGAGDGAAESKDRFRQYLQRAQRRDR